MPAAGRARPRGAGRALGAVLVVMVLITAVLAVGDYLVRSHVQSRFETELAQHLDAEDADVTIDAMVFLPQLLRGHVQSARVSATSVRFEALDVHEVRADLAGVNLDAPYHVGHVELQAALPEPTLQALLSEAGVPDEVTVDVTDGDLLAQGRLLGIPLRVALDPQARGRSIAITVQTVQLGEQHIDIQQLPDVMSEWLTDLELELTDLPDPLRVEHIEVGADDVVLRLEGHDLAIRDL